MTTSKTTAYFDTDFFSYRLHYFLDDPDFTIFELILHDYKLALITFPMPPTYVDFITIMKILDVK